MLFKFENMILKILLFSLKNLQVGFISDKFLLKQIFQKWQFCLSQIFLQDKSSEHELCFILSYGFWDKLSEPSAGEHLGSSWKFLFLGIIQI